MKIQKGSEEWELMGDFYKLYELSLDKKFEDTQWSEEFFDACKKFKFKFKRLSLAKKLSDALEIENLEQYDKFKAERWKKGL